MDFIPYSLGDAIDWKLGFVVITGVIGDVPYSLGDAIDWKRNITKRR